MGQVNYGSFDPSKFNSMEAPDKGKLDNLSREEKIELGKQLSGVEKKTIGRFFKSLVSRFSQERRESYFIDRAEKYIDLQNKVSIIKSGSTSDKGISEQFIKKDDWGSEIKESDINYKEIFPIKSLGSLNKLEPDLNNINDLKLDLNKINIQFGDKDIEEMLQELLSKLGNKTFEDKTPVVESTSIPSENPSSAKAPTSEKVDQLFASKVNYAEKETQKGTSEEGKKHVMESLFRLNILPDPPDVPINIHGRKFSPDTMGYIYMSNNEQKKELMAEHLPLDKAGEISAQGRKYPVMQAAVESIKANLEKWDDLVLTDDQTALDDLQRNLAQQFKNLAALSEIISEASADPENARALMALSPEQAMVITQNPDGEPLNDKFAHLFQGILKGDADLTLPEAKEFIGAALKGNISQMNAELPKLHSPDELRAMRGNAPITTGAIKAQAQLHHAIRKAKGWAAGEPSLVKQGTSANDVFKMKNPTTTSSGKHAAFESKPGGIAAFFKVGAGGEEAAGVMEKMMWDIAVVMGLEDQFVPTGETEVRDGSQLTGGSEKAMQWNAEGGLDVVEGAKAPRRGGIQVAQQGQVLSEYRQSPGSKTAIIPKTEISKGTVASVVFGMFDAHGGNIFVTEDGKVKFFDNTRSLPNSNGFINRGRGCVSSYRCSLLDLPEAREKLSPEEIDQLKKDVAAYKQKIVRLKEYLNSPEAKGQLKKLPPGWMDVESSLTAMEERVALMEKALNSGKVETLQQLAEAANPSYRFAFALSYLDGVTKGEISAYSSSEDVQRRWHTAVGYSRSDQDLSKLAYEGFDVEQIKKWCDDPSLSMDDVVRNVQGHYTSAISNPLSTAEYNRRIQAGEAIKAEMLKGAAIDFKDWSRDYCQSELLLHNVNEFRNLGASSADLYSPGSISDAVEFAMLIAANPVLVNRNGKTTVIYNTSNGYRMKEIDLQSAPGKVKLDGKEIAISDFVASLRDVKTPPTFDELPVLTPAVTERSVVASKDGIVLRKSQDNASLVVAVKGTNILGGMRISQFKYPPGNDGKFIVDGEEKTIAEIIEKHKK